MECLNDYHYHYYYLWNYYISNVIIELLKSQ